MKNMIAVKTLGWLSAAAFLLTGCSTMNMSQGTIGYEKPAGSSAQEAQIVRDQIPVQVVDTSAAKSAGTSDVRALVASELAQAGFNVTDAAPYITVNLSTIFTPFDSFGNYQVYEGGSFISVTRDDSKLLLKKQIRVKGDRQLEAGRAIDSAENNLSADVAAEVVKVCSEETTAVSSVLVTLNGYFDWRVDRFANEMRGTKGILSCRRISEGEKTAQYRVVYDARRFPDGIKKVVEEASDWL